MANDGPKDSKVSFWSTLPGLLTALAGTIGAIATLVTALNSAGVFRGQQAQPPSRGPESAAAVAPAPLPQPASPSAGSAGAVPGAAEVDPTNAASTAAAVLRAFKGRDLLALARLSNETSRKIFAELVEQGESHPRYKSIFSGWRWQAVQAWQGHVGETRYRDREHLEALVAFGEMRSDREVETFVVVLQWIDGKWAFEDINSPDKPAFEQMRKSR